MRLFYVEKIRFVMFTMFSHKKLETVSVFVINGFVYCSNFCILNHVISIVTFRSWV